MKSHPSPVKALALQRGYPVFQPPSLRDPTAHQPIREVAPDVLVVAAYGLILPQAVLDIPRFGAINIHASLLPRWRGAAPIQRAILAGDSETGISIMKMDAGLDTGPVLLQKSCAIRADDDAASLHDRLAELGAEMIVRALGLMEAAGVVAVVQPDAGTTYANKIDKAETQIDWTQSAVALERAVRAFRPSPGASTSLHNIPLKIWCAEVIPEMVEHASIPGTVLAADAAGMVVACGSGCLRVTELQRAGGKRLSFASFLGGQQIAPGTRLGA
jgi:methionyl-tRNA formyltransferase